MFTKVLCSSYIIVHNIMCIRFNFGISITNRLVTPFFKKICVLHYFLCLLTVIVIVLKSILYFGWISHEMFIQD